MCFSERGFGLMGFCHWCIFLSLVWLTAFRVPLQHPLTMRFTVQQVNKYHRFTESYNGLDWKRCQRSSSSNPPGRDRDPTRLGCSLPSLVWNCYGWGIHGFSGQPVSVPRYSLRKYLLFFLISLPVSFFFPSLSYRGAAASEEWKKRRAESNPK